MGVECEVYLIDDWSAFSGTLMETNMRNGRSSCLTGNRGPAPVTSTRNMTSWLVSLQCEESGSVRRRLLAKDLFEHLFWSDRGKERYQIVEIGGMPRPFGLDVAWAPETTKRFGEMARRVDLDQCRAVFAKGRQRRFDTHEEFAEYGEFWLDVVRRGAASGWGLAVVIFG